MMVAVDQVTSVSLQLFSVSHPLTEWLRFSEEQRGGRTASEHVHAQMSLLLHRSPAVVFIDPDDLPS